MSPEPSVQSVLPQSVQSSIPPLRLWRNARLATMCGGSCGPGIIEAGSIAAENGRIVYAGPEYDMPARWTRGEINDCEGRWITPGLIDCHTHLIHDGSRAEEFARRLAGATYEEIARAGGGITSTVRATRAASEDSLVASALPRLDQLISEGLTTIEIKSGYGLDLATERSMLRAARRLADLRDVDVVTTFLGAHALPPDFTDDKDAYIHDICTRMMPAIAEEKLADAVDGFCEGIAFSPAQISRLFEAAHALGLPVRLHADQLSSLGGAALAARYGALSADHLEYTDAAGVQAMAEAGTVAVLLPGAYYFLRETQKPPLDALRAAGVRMALATDNNPGTSPLTSLLLTMNMGATLFRMTVEECLAGVTRQAAHALGRGDMTGTLEPGKFCDLAIWSISTPSELVYNIGFNPLFARVKKGR